MPRVSKLFLLLSMVSSLVLPTTPVSASEELYLDDCQFVDSVYVIPKASEETFVQTGTVYATKEAYKDEEKVTMGSPLGIVFKAQNKDGLMVPTGSQKDDFVPDLKDGPLRESCLIPLTEGDIWVYSHGKKKVIDTEKQKQAKQLIECFDGEKLTDRVKELGIKTQLSELELLECEQIALVEILENEEYETIQTLSEEKLSVVKQLKEVSAKTTKVKQEVTTDLKIEKFTDTEIELNREPNDSEYIELTVDGETTRMKDKKVTFSASSSVSMHGYLRKKVCCYIKDIPELKKAVVVEKEARDSTAMNYVGMVYVNDKEMVVKDKKFELTDYEASNDMLENSRLFNSQEKFEKYILPAMFCVWCLGTIAFIWFEWKVNK